MQSHEQKARGSFEGAKTRRALLSRSVLLGHDYLARRPTTTVTRPVAIGPADPSVQEILQIEHAVAATGIQWPDLPPPPGGPQATRTAVAHPDPAAAERPDPGPRCDTRRVPRRLLTTSVLTLVTACAAGGPAVALADSGPSAGDNQYTDPLASTTTSTASLQSTPPTSVTQSTTLTSTTPVASPTTTPVQTATSTSAAPATATSTATTAGASKSLPHTGYDLPLVFVLGAAVTGAGALIRRRAAAE